MKTIKATKVTKYYGAFKAIENVSFEVNRGEIFCFLGENGAGKSTMIKLLTGILDFDDQDRGIIKILGTDVQKMSDDIRNMIGYVPEERNLIDDLTGNEYLDFVAILHKVKRDEILVERKTYLLDLFKMTERKDRLIRFYSNGMKKKILLIAALIHNPAILVVDEPFAALDPESIYIFKKMLLQLAKKGCTILLCSHNLKIIEDVCNRMIVLHQGNILFDGNKEALNKKTGSKNLEESYIKILKGQNEIKRIDADIQNIPYSIENLE